jgi:hypothetical protein
LHGHIFALDGAYRVVGRLIGARGGRKVEDGEENGGQRQTQKCATDVSFCGVDISLASRGKPPHSKKADSFGDGSRQ